MRHVAKVEICESCVELRDDGEPSLRAGALDVRRTNSVVAGERNSNCVGCDQWRSFARSGCWRRGTNNR